MMFSSIRSLTRLRPHSSYIITRTINVSVSVKRPIIHTWSRYQSTTTESIIVPTINDTSTSSTSTTTTSPSATHPTVTEPITTTSDESTTSTSTSASEPTTTHDPAAAAATSTSNMESVVDDETTPESATSTSTSTSTSTTATPKRSKLNVERSKTVYIPFHKTLAWFEHKVQIFGKVTDLFSVSTPEGLRIYVKYDHFGDAYHAAKFFSSRQYKCGELHMHLIEDRVKTLTHLPVHPTKDIMDRKRVEITIPLTDAIKQYLQQFGNVEVYGMIQKFHAYAVFETEDAAVSAVAQTPKGAKFQTGVVHVNAPVLKDNGFKSSSRPSTTRTTRTKKNNVPSKASTTSLWNETIDPASGQTYYWHSETRQVTWERPAELGPKQ